MTYDNVPRAMRDRPQWVLWRYERRKGQPKPTKVPYHPSGRRASSTAPRTWVDFDTAVSAAKEPYRGIGFVIAEDDPFVCVDVDTSTPSREVSRLLADLGPSTYRETSPGGAGLHVWTVGAIPKPRKTSDVEIYDRARFVTVTGRTDQTRTADLEFTDSTDTFNRHWESLFGAAPAADNGAPTTVVDPVSPRRESGEILRMLAEWDDREVGEDGNIAVRQDQNPSEGRWALATRAAFYSQYPDVIAEVIEIHYPERAGEKRDGVPFYEWEARRAIAHVGSAHIDEWAGPRWWSGQDYGAVNAAFLARWCAKRGASSVDEWIERETKRGALVTLAESDPEAAGELNLPSSFWESRRSLRTVRQMAWRYGTSPDAALGATLARIAATMPPRVKLPPIAGPPGPLTLLVAVTGPPGTGKGTSFYVGGELVPYPDEGTPGQDMPVGTGQGMVETYFAYKELDSVGRGKGPKERIHYGSFFTLDESEDLGNETYRTAWSTMQTMFTGGNPGKSNAAAENRRSLKAGSYSAGVALALQPEVTKMLLDRAKFGTPQRFVFTFAGERNAPDGADAPAADDVQSLTASRDLAYESRDTPFPVDMTFPQDIADGIRDRHTERRRNAHMVQDDPDAHRDLLAMKIAALLRLIEGRPEGSSAYLGVTHEDWDLAQQILACSERVMAHNKAMADRAAERSEESARDRKVREAVAVASAVADADTVSVAMRIRSLVSKKGRQSRGDLWRGVSQRQRDRLDDGITYATENAWIVRVGTDKGGDAYRLP